MTEETDRGSGEPSLVPMLRRIRAALDADGHRIATELGLSAREFHYLTILGEEDGLPQTELGRRGALSPSTVTRLVDRLEMRGLVRRVRDVGDRRRQRVCLTVQGRQIAARTRDRLERRLARAVERLPVGSRTEIARALGRIVTLIQTIQEDEHLRGRIEHDRQRPAG